MPWKYNKGRFLYQESEFLLANRYFGLLGYQKSIFVKEISNWFIRLGNTNRSVCQRAVYWRPCICFCVNEWLWSCYQFLIIEFVIYALFRIEIGVICLYDNDFSNKCQWWLIDDVISDVINPRKYHKLILHVIANRKRGHLPIFILICLIIPISGCQKGSKVGKGKNVIKIFSSKNCCLGPISMYITQKYGI